MPHHLKQTVHHNINQDMGTENIERPNRSADDPVVEAELNETPGGRHNRHGSDPQEKPPRGLGDTASVTE